MKISMVSEHGSPLTSVGGVDAGAQNVHVTALASALADRGHDVTVFTRRDSPDLPLTVTIDDGFKVVNIKAGPEEHVPRDEQLSHMEALGQGIASYWGQHPETIPDIVHSHFWTSGIAAREALDIGRLSRVPLVHTFHALGTVKRRHQGFLDTSPEERAELEPQVGHDATCLIATCSDEIKEIEAMGIDRSKAVVVPSGVDIRLFRPDCRAEDTGGRRRIVSIGRLVARKGIDLTISALAHLDRAGYEDVDLHIIGGAEGSCLQYDPEAQRLKEVAEELGIADRVILRGRVPRSQMPSIIRSASVVACTPWYEPFGIVPLEAMACGVPVVAAEVGGLADSVVDGVTGLHVPAHAPKAIATSIALLLDEPNLGRELGRNGVERVRERYSWSQVAKATEEVYEGIVDSSDSPDVRESPYSEGLTDPRRDELTEFDRVERARKRDRSLEEEATRMRLAERVEALRQRQVQVRERSDDSRMWGTLL